MINNYKEKDINSLIRVLVLIDSMKDMRNFIEDVLSVKELSTVATRLTIARMLDANIPYSVINERTGVSTATIAKLANKLRKKSGGLSMVLEDYVSRNALID